MSVTEKKVLFVSLLILVIALKVYGAIAGKLAWPLIIILGFISVVTEPSNLGCTCLPGEQMATNQ